jgi:aquaglyceroporin related protein
MTDKKNMSPPQGLAPLFLFLVILGIGAALGMETGEPNFYSWGPLGN